MAQTKSKTPFFKYKCTADFNYYGPDPDLLNRRVITATVDRLSDITEGFWVNKDLSYTRGEDCMFYVMPHHVLSVEKVAVYDDEA